MVNDNPAIKPRFAIGFLSTRSPGRSLERVESLVLHHESVTDGSSMKSSSSNESSSLIGRTDSTLYFLPMLMLCNWYRPIRRAW